MAASTAGLTEYRQRVSGCLEKVWILGLPKDALAEITTGLLGVGTEDELDGAPLNDDPNGSHACKGGLVNEILVDYPYAHTCQRVFDLADILLPAQGGQELLDVHVNLSFPCQSRAGLFDQRRALTGKILQAPTSHGVGTCS